MVIHMLANVVNQLDARSSGLSIFWWLSLFWWTGYFGRLSLFWWDAYSLSLFSCGQSTEIVDYFCQLCVHTSHSILQNVCFIELPCQP